jgi:tryptophanase
MAEGLKEGVEEDYLHYRITSTGYLGDHLHQAGVPIMRPPGGHAIYLDAARFAPHLKSLELPGISLCIELYVVGGIRAVEIGTAMFGKRNVETGEEEPGPRELVRLAIPRRVYTQSHVDYIVEVVEEVFQRREHLKPFRFLEQAPFLRHFTAQYSMVERSSK